MPKVNTVHKKPSSTEAAYDKYIDCAMGCEKKCLGQVLCSGCGTKVKVMQGPGRKLSSAKPTRKLTPGEASRQRAMCASGPLSKREKKELLRIASALGVRGVSMRTTKAALCSKIRAATQ